MNKKQRAIIGGLLLIAIFLFFFWPKPRLAKHSPESAVVTAPAAGPSPAAKVETTLTTPAKTPGVPKPKIVPQQTISAEDDSVAAAEDQNYFLGRWCNNDLWKDNNEYFSLEFSLSDAGEIKAVFANNGPFSETLNAKVSGAEADLYFEFVEGSMSFNETATKYDAKDCTERVASAAVMDQNSLQISHFNDVCGYMSAVADSLLLTRLHEGETCIPD